MIQLEKVKFRITHLEPNPKEVDYWIDLNSNKFGGLLKYYDEGLLQWKLLNLNELHLEKILDHIAELFTELEEEQTQYELAITARLDALESKVNSLIQ